MPLTNFEPGGAKGFPVIGAGLGYGWKTDSNIYFVDYAQGSDGNPGTDPDTPFKTIEKAVATISAYDVVYVMEAGWSGSDPVSYIGASANHTVALADVGVAFVGVSHAGMLGYPLSPYIMGLDTMETPVFTVNAPLTAWENLAFSGNWGNANEATAGIYCPDNVSGTAMGQGISIYNCYFEDFEGTTATSATTAPGGGISLVGNWHSVVNHCRFRNCVVGIQLLSSANTIVGTTLEHCTFFADADTDVNADISLYAQGLCNVLINDMYFAHRCPAYASGSALRYISVIGGAETGLVTNCHCANEAALTIGDDGTGFIIPATMQGGANYCFCALMANATGV